MSENLVTIKEGQEVTGRIINVSKDAIYLELPNETKGVIYTNDLSDYVEGQKLRDYYFEGGEFTALVKQIAKDKKSDANLYILSTKLYKARTDLKVFDELKANDEIIQAKVMFVNHAGADLLYKNHSDIKVFLPLKNIYLKEEALRALKGQMIDVVVTTVDHDAIKVIVSNAAAQAKIKKAKYEASFNSLELNSVVEGTVESVTDFGAFVKLGEVTALLHRNELDHKMVRNVNDYVKVGQTINAKIIKIEDGKVGLSLKALKAHPWDVLTEKFHVGDVFDGEVKQIIPAAGVLIKLTDEYAGLMPNVEYSWRTNERVADNVKEGDTLTVKIVSIDGAKKRISLSHRETVENTWKNVNLQKGAVVNVEIAKIEEKGAVVNYENVSNILDGCINNLFNSIYTYDELYKQIMINSDYDIFIPNIIQLQKHSN